MRAGPAGPRPRRGKWTSSQKGPSPASSRAADPDVTATGACRHDQSQAERAGGFALVSVARAGNPHPDVIRLSW